MKRWYWAVDILVIISFAVVGADVHTTSGQVGNILRITSPFLLALAGATYLFRKRFDPLGVLHGVLVGLATLTFGMLLRVVVWKGGSAQVFMLVAGAWMVGLMGGWRLLRLGFLRLRGQSSR